LIGGFLKVLRCEFRTASTSQVSSYWLTVARELAQDTLVVERQ
jgi:hypothetical protein